MDKGKRKGVARSINPSKMGQEGETLSTYVYRRKKVSTTYGGQEGPLYNLKNEVNDPLI